MACTAGLYPHRLYNRAGRGRYGRYGRLCRRRIPAGHQLRAGAYNPACRSCQTGLSFDLKPYNKVIDDVSSNEEYLWLRDNAHKFGFIFRFNKEHESLTGFSSATWRLRYVGEDAANIIFNEGISFEEYYAYFVGE